MPKVNEREYRAMAAMQPDEEQEYRVSGYASTFEPYVMYSYDGIDYYERIDPHAFDGADMSDVIMQYDHNGRVFARTGKGLELSIDAKGLKVDADLSLSSRAKDLFEDIKAGLITKMSFAFTVAEDGYDRDTHTRTIYKVKKVYDVSAVSIPANDGTSIDIKARSFFDGVIEREQAERLECKRKRLQLITKIGGMKK